MQCPKLIFGQLKNSLFYYFLRVLTHPRVHPTTSESNLLELLPWLCVRDSFWDQLMINWLRAQSQVLFNMYAQPSDKMASQILLSTKTWDLASFYNGFIGPSVTKTQQKNIWKQSQCVSSPKIQKKTISELSIAIFQLACLTIFYACQSWKFLQIPQSPSSRAVTNNNPSLSKHLMFQRRQTHWSQQCRIRILGCHLVDLQKAETRWKK